MCVGDLGFLGYLGMISQVIYIWVHMLINKNLF